ncbi:MAG: helix-turn-helix domain-containing protein [Clostridiales bacterium]|nr:helix-turn-helix domain-containing protein [Clostridiales bacterium]
MNKFAIRLKEVRIEKSYSQSKLAERLNVDQRTISNWEKAVREPDFDMLIKITQLFDVSADYLLGLTD